jgi:hypothetical protein
MFNTMLCSTQSCLEELGMRIGTQFHRSRNPLSLRFSLTAALVLVFVVLSGSQNANALPAFARKYGLRCSACHETWPILNNFGLKFRDNGYQLMNDRDAPIWQNPSYWPVTFRITPVWHRVSGLSDVDTYAGGTLAVADGALQRITSSGFDLSGLDFHTGGTLEKNISFYVLPSSDSTAAFHFETVMARFDNLFGSPWLNIKMGRFELNNLLSEKRMVQLTGNGGIYQTYHFIPQGDGNIFAQLGDNQLGMEYVGHSMDDRTRLSAALLSSSDGNVNLITGANSYSTYVTFDQGIDLGKLGVDRLGAYVFAGQAATYYRTTSVTGTSAPIPGSGISNKGYTRVGFTGQFYFGPHFDLNVVTQHGTDNAWFGQGYGNPIATDGNGGATCGAPAGTPGCPVNNFPGTVLPTGAQAPTWNGVTFEGRYVYSPQLIFIGEFEAERMSQQANGPSYSTTVTGGNGFTGPMASNLGNINNYDFLIRYNPFMTNRAGLAVQLEYNLFHQIGTGPTSPATGLAVNTNTNELMLALDFDF